MAAVRASEPAPTWRIGAMDAGLMFSALGTALVVFIAVFLPARTGVLFNTPDETVNHLFTKTFAETGKLWYTTDYLALDDENLLHPRGVLTHNDRAVSYQFLGLPAMYGSVYRVVGENVKYVGAFLALATLFFLYKTANRLFDAPYWQVLVAFLSTTPLLFHFARPYLAATPAITFFAGGGWLLVRYFQESRRRDLVLATGMFTVAMAFRAEFMIFSSLLVAAALWHKHERLAASGLWRDLFVYGAIVGVLFVAPLLMLNQIVYGGPLTYGYGVFNDVYLPYRGPQDGASVVENGARMAAEVLLPQLSVDIELLMRNLARFTFGLMPVLATLALIGAVLALGRQKIQRRYLVGYALVALYLLVYMGGNDTWNATTKFVTFDASFVRYWLPFSLVLALLAVYMLHELRNETMRLTLASVLVLYGSASVLTMTQGSLQDVAKAVDRYEAWAEGVIVPNTEEEAIIYTGNVDKAIIPYRDVAAWWASTYDRDQTARSMARVLAGGRPVYLYKERSLDIDDLNEALEEYDLNAVGTAPALYRVVRLDDRGE